VVTKNSTDRPEGNVNAKLRMALSQNYICMSIDRFGKNASDILSTINLIISKQRYCREGDYKWWLTEKKIQLLKWWLVFYQHYQKQIKRVEKLLGHTILSNHFISVVIEQLHLKQC
jgi:hypothetical protein